MSVVRLSVVEETVFAPKTRGDWVKDDFVQETPVGKLGTLVHPAVAKPDSPFWEYLTNGIKAQTGELGTTPIAVTVHGFMADPRDEIKDDKPQRSDNPHDCSFHFSDKVQRHWRHTASWPLGLGFKEGDKGKSGLTVAFGWNSTPDLFTRGFSDTWKVLGKEFGEVRGKELGLRGALQLGAEVAQLAKAGLKIEKALRDIDGPLDYEVVIKKLDDVLRDKDVEEALLKIADRLPKVYREPYARAVPAAWVLVNTLRAIADTLPERPIDLFCHSLGSRVVIQAVHQIAIAAQEAQGEAFKKLLKRLGRVIIVGGAEYSVHAQKMLAELKKVLPTGPAFYNFMARRDRVLQILAESFHPIDPKLRRTVGRCGLGLNEIDSRWLDLQLDANKDDSHPLNKWLEPRNIAVVGVHRLGVLNHWNYFTEVKNMAIYKAILRQRDDWDIGLLRMKNIREREGVECPTE